MSCKKKEAKLKDNLKNKLISIPFSENFLMNFIYLFYYKAEIIKFKVGI